MDKYKSNSYLSYNYGSTAPDFYQEVHKPLKHNKEQQERSRKRYIENKKLKFKKRIKMFIIGTAVFASCIGFVWGSSVVSYKQYELKEAKAHIKNLKNEVNTTKALIASATNLDHIKQRAITELNMLEPLPHQIIYLDIKKTSYTVVEMDNKQ